MSKLLTAAERHANLTAAIAELARAKANPKAVIELAASGDLDTCVAQYLEMNSADAIAEILRKGAAALAPAVAAEKSAAAQKLRADERAAATRAEASREFDRIAAREDNALARLAEYLTGINCPDKTPPSDSYWFAAARDFVRSGEPGEPGFVITDDTRFRQWMLRVGANYPRWRFHGQHDDEMLHGTRPMPARLSIRAAG